MPGWNEVDEEEEEEEATKGKGKGKGKAKRCPGDFTDDDDDEDDQGMEEEAVGDEEVRSFHYTRSLVLTTHRM